MRPHRSRRSRTVFTGAIQIPGNLVELISLQCDGHELTMRPVTEVKALQATGFPAPARYYTREVGSYLIAPIPPTGSQIEMTYRADFGDIVQDTDTCRLFDVAPECVTYAALTYAGAYAIDPDRMATWNQMYGVLLAEVQDLAYRAELLNASVRPAFNTNGDWNCL